MKIFDKIKQQVKKISFINRWLLVLMVILLIQSGHNLFANESISQNTSSIDTIVRTSSAAIFGYFISANFVRRNTQVSDKAQPATCNKIQVTIISFIGCISLVMLLILRNRMEITPHTTATVSQLRDFISASVGFLVSCGKNHPDE